MNLVKIKLIDKYYFLSLNILFSSLANCGSSIDDEFWRLQVLILIKNKNEMMKLGLIIPCNNIEETIDVSAIISLIELYSHVHICFVNNGSSDNTIGVLDYLKRKSDVEVSVLDVKRNKNQLNVIKAGARYLNAREELDHVQSISIDFSMSLERIKNIFEEDILKEHEFYDSTINKTRLSKNS